MKRRKKPAKPTRKPASDKPVPDGNRSVFNTLLRRACPDKPAASGRGTDDPVVT